MSKRRKSRKVKPWTVEEAQQFLASAREADDLLYAAFVLILVLGLRRGEVLGLTWELVDLDQAELFVGEQLQRVNHKILRRETKTEASEAPLPLPAICVAALKLRKKQQDAARRAQCAAFRHRADDFSRRRRNSREVDALVLADGRGIGSIRRVPHAAGHRRRRARQLGAPQGFRPEGATKAAAPPTAHPPI